MPENKHGENHVENNYDGNEHAKDLKHPVILFPGEWFLVAQRGYEKGKHYFASRREEISLAI